MTPEERVDALGKNPCLCDPPVMQSQRACSHCTADAIRAAVAEERAILSKHVETTRTAARLAGVAEERKACVMWLRAEAAVNGPSGYGSSAPILRELAHGIESGWHHVEAPPKEGATK